MRVTNCARCGGTHDNVEMQMLTNAVAPKPDALWFEFIAGEGLSKEQSYGLLRAKLNNDPSAASIVWSELQWNAWAPCPVNGQPIMIYSTEAKKP